MNAEKEFNFWKSLGVVIGILFGVAVIVAALSVVGEMAWNFVMPLFGLPDLGVLQFTVLLLFMSFFVYWPFSVILSLNLKGQMEKFYEATKPTLVGADMSAEEIKSLKEEFENFYQG